MTQSSPHSALPLQYEDGPDYCKVTTANGADFALTVKPQLLKRMEQAFAASLQPATPTGGEQYDGITPTSGEHPKQHWFKPATGGDAPEIDRLRAALKDAEVRADLYANSRPVVEAATPTELIERVAIAIDAAVVKWQLGSGIGIKELAARAAIEAIDPAQCGREPLSALAGMFSESAHETWTKEEIVNIIEDAIRLGSPHSSTEDK